MELYSKEQIKKAYELIRRGDRYFDKDEILEQLTPIELPSDEDIEKKSYKLFHQNDNIGKGTWIYGAKWMKEQILNQNIPELRNADGTYGQWGTSGINNQNKK